MSNSTSRAPSPPAATSSSAIFTPPVRLPSPAASSSSASVGWFSSWRNSGRDASSTPVPDLGVNANFVASSTTRRVPSSITLSGESTLDSYALRIDVMLNEVAEVRSRFTVFGQQIVNMSTVGSGLAEVAKKIADDAPCDPGALVAFTLAHQTQSTTASALFLNDEFSLEVLEPLDIWTEEAQQFLRELTRTVQAWRKSEEVRERVDKMLEEAAEKQQQKEEQSHSTKRQKSDDEDDSDDIESELTLKLAKTDLGEACTNYSARLQGLERHFNEVQSGRIAALDVAFTRFIGLQSLLLRPALRTVERQLEEDGALFSPRSGGLAAVAAAAANSFSPRTPASRARLSAGTNASTYRKSQLEEDIIRMSRRLNRKKFYSPLTHHYHADLNTGINIISPTSRAMIHGTDGQIHSSSSTQRVSYATMPVPQAARQADGAILDACRLLQQEIESRRMTQEENEELRKQLEQLKEEAKKREVSLAAQSELEEVKRKMLERENGMEKPNSSGALDAPPAPSSDAPTAPPLDIPPPPGAPSMSFAPGGSSSSGITIRKQASAREKEIAEAIKYGLVLLPDVERIDEEILDSEAAEGDASSSAPIDEKDRIKLKKLHWLPLTTEEVAAGTKDEMNVWKELFGTKHIEKKGTVDATDGVQNGSTTNTDLSHLLHPIITPLSPSDAAPQWRWTLDLPEFTAKFAQKATVSMKKKAKRGTEGNKYAVRRGHKNTNSTSSIEGQEDELNGDEDGDENAESSNGTHSRSKSTKLTSLPRIELIDAKRSYNVSISLTHFKLSPEAIKQAILEFDSDALKRGGKSASTSAAITNTGSDDLLDILLDILPTNDESKLIRDWINNGGDASRLAEIETFFHILSSPPSLPARLRVLVTIESFSMNASGIEDALEGVHSGVKAIERAKDAIAILLAIVLRVGNLMNASATTAAHPPIASSSSSIPSTSTSTVRHRSTKQSYGFVILPTLAKLSSVRSLDGSSSLLTYLVSYLSIHAPAVAEAICDLAAQLRVCARIEQAYVVAEMKQLRQDVNAAKTMVDEEEKLMKLDSHDNSNDAPTSALSITEFSAPFASSSSSHSLTLTAPSESPSISAASSPSAAASSNQQQLYIPLPPRVATFCTYATSRLTEIDRQYAVLQSEYSGLLSYYLLSSLSSSSSTPTSWESFLSAWYSFCFEFSETREALIDAKEQEAKRVRREAHAEVMKKKREQQVKEKKEREEERAREKDKHEKARVSPSNTTSSLEATTPQTHPVASPQSANLPHPSPLASASQTGSTTATTPTLPPSHAHARRASSEFAATTSIPSATNTTSHSGSSTPPRASSSITSSPLQNMSALSARAAVGTSPVSSSPSSSHSLAKSLMNFIPFVSSGSKSKSNSNSSSKAGSKRNSLSETRTNVTEKSEGEAQQ